MARSIDLLDIDIDQLDEFKFPEPEFYKDATPKQAKKSPKGRKRKKSNFLTQERKEAYEAFLRWSATPKELREPKTEAEFERVWKLPASTIYQSFKQREDFHRRRMGYFWNWVFDKYPDVIHAVYRRAIQNSTADAKIFSELVAKKLESQTQTKAKMTPFMLVGIPQHKINALFTPEGVEEAEVIDGESD
ncbi:MAG: hypothetical protein ACWGNP_04700 [Candidatus Bathyarchaeia archaeon]